MKNIYIIKQQNGTYTAFSTYAGVSMGTTIHNRPELTKEEVENMMRDRISTQMVNSKRKNSVVIDEVRRRQRSGCGIVCVCGTHQRNSRAYSAKNGGRR